MRRPRLPVSEDEFLRLSGIVPSKGVKAALAKVFEAAQMLMVSGSSRQDAEEIIRRMAFGTHMAPEGVCEERS